MVCLSLQQFWSHEFSLLVGAHCFLGSLVDCQLHSKAMYPLVLFMASHFAPLVLDKSAQSLAGL